VTGAAVPGRALLATLGGASTESVQFGGELKTFAVIAAFTDQPEPAFPVVTS
jgi:hypothetical protein